MATESARTAVDTDLYPVFASKAALLLKLEEVIEQRNYSDQRELLLRLSNTDTSTFADPTASHED